MSNLPVDNYLIILDRWVFKRYAMHYNCHEDDDEVNAKKCEEILNLVREDGHRIAVDESMNIISEWEEFFNNHLIRKWFKYMSNGKLVRVERSELEKPIDDNDDQHYAEIAIDSEASIMFSGDRPLKEDINTRKDIDLGIWDQNEGLGLLLWAQSEMELEED